MPTPNDRYVVHTPDGKWAVKRAKAERASSIHDTKAEAEVRAKGIVSKLGGGEVRLQNSRGQWADSDTVPPGNDPNPPRDTRH